MSAFPTKRPRTNDSTSNSKKPRVSFDPSSKATESTKSTTAPRPAPSFLSSLQSDETDFPRGGGSSLTALEYKQVREEGRREAEDEVRKESASAGVGQGVKRKRQVSEREKKRLEKNVVKKPVKEIEGFRVEHLTYKRLATGTRLLTRVHTVLPLHLILSLPNNLLAHVPITEISSTLTSLLTAEAEDDSNEGSDAASSSSTPSAPDLSQIFQPGQYFPAKVLQTYPTASQSFVSQYPMTEVTRLAARVEMTLVPEKVNSEVGKGEVGEKGFLIVGEVKGEEDKGWRVGLGVEGGVEGWVSREDVERLTPAKTLIPGQLLPCTTTNSTAGGRIMQVTLDPIAFGRAQLSEISNIGSIIPGHAVSALITAVTPSGLNVKVCGFFDGTIDLAHLGLGTDDIDEKYKIGKKIRARILYDNLAHNPRKFALSVLPHILAFSSPTTADKSTTLEEAIQIGKVFNSVTVTRVIPEWGVICRTDDGLEGFVHISHVSDERLSALSSTTGQYRSGTVHRARVIGQSPLDGILLLSFEQKVLDQVFMQVGELKVGQALKGTIRRLTDKALFIDINGSVDGMVYPLHYADIRLKHPEKRFKVGSTVKARVLALEPARSRIILTLKRTLIDSELEVASGIEEVKVGLITPGVVCKILDKGCLVEMFGGVKAFVPVSEASQSFVTNLNDIFFVGKSVNVRVTEVDEIQAKIVASIKQALPTALAAAKLDVGSSVAGLVSQIHKEQVVITLIPSQSTALLSLSNLSNHRHMGVDELRASLKVGEHIDDLIIVSKNTASGLYIVSNKRTESALNPSSGSGVSKPLKAIDAIQVGQIIPGRVLNHTPQGTMIQISPSIRGRVHPCDASDDFSTIALGKGPLIEGTTIKCYVLNSNRAARIFDLSTRQSRLHPESAVEVVDKEIVDIKDMKEGEGVRGLIKNVGDHGVFVALGRNVTARIMIRELFDDFVEDWKAKFEVNQLVEGKILSVDGKKGLVEMTLRKNAKGGGSKGVVKLGLGDFEEGQKVVAVVKRVETYGMFLRIENTEVSGLCHKSEISDNKKQDVSQALKGFREGDQVKAKIVKIEREKGKINFGIKASYFGEEFEGEGDGGDVDVDGDGGDGVGSEEVIDGEGDEDDVDDDEDAAEEEDEGEGDEEGEVESDDEEEVDVLQFEGDSEEEAADEDSDDASEVAVVQSTKSSNKPSPTSGLKVSNGFDWSGNAPTDASTSDESDSENEDPSARPTKSKGKSRATDLTASSTSTQPQSSTEFERALLASPNSSFLWIQYMSFHLQLHETDRARQIGRMALGRINYREEEEKLNVWMALVNLEIGFGSQGTLDAVFKEASEFNDKRTVYLRYAEALQASGKDNLVEDVYKKLVKRFSEYPESWTKFAEYYLKKGDVDSARELLPRSMKSLDKSKHVETIEKMAILEFKYGDAERGKTLFEGLVDRAPKRLDLWSVYVDQLTKAGDVQSARGLVDRVLDQKLTGKRAKFIFKKWFAVEVKIGDLAGQEKAKNKAREWVTAHAQSVATPESDEGEEDD